MSHEKDLEFPINQKLLEEATKAMEEWRIIKDRLIRIDENRENVSDSVYDRVRKDYDARLDLANDNLLKAKNNIDAELSALAETREKVHSQLKQHEQRLEEIVFRNNLGEYKSDDFQNASKLEQDKINRFETVLAAVDNNIHRYESIFDNNAELFLDKDIQENTKDETNNQHVQEASASNEPATDDSGYIIEDKESDYFGSPIDIMPSGSSDEVAVPKESNPKDQSIDISNASEPPSVPYDVSITKHSPIEPESARESIPTKKPARMVVINSEIAGSAFPLKGKLSIGRADSNAITIKDAKASRQHAQVLQHGNEFVVTDLNSSNGTYVNDERIEEYVLSNGDEIQIGDTIMQFQIEN